VSQPVFRGALLLLLLSLFVTAPYTARAADAQTRFMFLRGQSIHPSFEGWWPNNDGSFTLWFGYMNSNWEEELDFPIGSENYFSIAEPNTLDDLTVEAFDAATADRGQPTHFYPRRNPFLFTVQVPADFGEREVVWTLTSHGRTNRAFATLSADYRMDPQVLSTEVGGAFGSLDDRLRTNLPPDLAVEGGMQRSAKVGEPLTLIASANDPDNFPERSDRGQLPKDLDEFYTTAGVGSSVVSSAPGVRLSWIVFRGPADHAMFEPIQMKAWMDTRVWGNSPWSPPYILPEPPAGNRWENTVTFRQPGEYTLRAVASDGAHFSYENVTVQVTR